MRHRLLDHKLGRKTAHRQALMSALARALLEQKRIQTSLVKARATKRVAERLVTVAKDGLATGTTQGQLSARRRALSILGQWKHVGILFDQIAPACESRKGGYTRLIHLSRRIGDGSQQVLLEWVDVAAPKREKKVKQQDAQEAAAKK